MDAGHPVQGQPGHPGQENPDGTLDMELNLHDFGEGIGVDMRDFPSHSGDEGDDGMTGGMVGTMEEHHGQRGHPGSSHLTPQVTPSVPGRSSHPPSSVTPNGERGGPVNIDDMFKAETGLDDDDDDDDDAEATPHAKRPRVHADQPGGFTYVDKDGEAGRRKIRIEYIGDKSRRHITFSKRKAGIMKKAYELSILTGTQVLLLVVSETGLVYTFTTTKLQPLVQKAEGKNLIQACLNAPDGFGPDGQPLTGPVPATKAKNGGLAIRPHKLTPSASAALAASAQAASANQNGNDEHAQAQSDAAAAVGQGTPSSARPKKRMPSGKGKKAQAAAAAEAAAANANGAGVNNNDNLVPPVPTIPDMHRQSSPHSAHLVPPSLASPMSGGYHIPPEYHHSPTNATFGYATHPGNTPGEYNQGYYAPPPGQGHPHHHPHQQAHPGYLGVGPGGHPQHPGQHPQHGGPQQHGMYQEDPRDRRMMMEGQQGRMGMGM